MNKLLFLFLLLPFISFCQTVDIDFKISETYSTSTGPGNIVKGFFNSDTIPDLAVANNDGNSVTVFLGSGDSTFASINSFNALRPIYIVAGYIDADTNTDFAIATVNNQNYYVNIYLGAGDGVTFTSTDSNYTLGGPPTWMVGIDFNKDGVLDLATANSSSSSGSISILQGIYGGGFE